MVDRPQLGDRLPGGVSTNAGAHLILVCANCGRDVRDGHFKHCPRPNDLNWKVADMDEPVMVQSHAEIIVEAVLADLRGRAGLDNEFDAIDPETYQEMRAELIDIVAAKL